MTPARLIEYLRDAPQRAFALARTWTAALRARR
jgi:hypothetical protein